MTNVENSTPKSIFASIDKRSDDFVDDKELAESFTRLVWRGGADFAIDVEMVHLTGADDVTVKTDFEDKKAFRRYAIWKENGNLFGAWVFCYTEEGTPENDEEILYPQILGNVVKKSHEIVEDIYTIEKLGLPVAWVTYHNAQ
jgi:hypothetical protein